MPYRARLFKGWTNAWYVTSDDEDDDTTDEGTDTGGDGNDTP